MLSCLKRLPKRVKLTKWSIWPIMNKFTIVPIRNNNDTRIYIHIQYSIYIMRLGQWSYFLETELF